MNNENFFDSTIILQNETVRLEPLEATHFEQLLPTAMQAKIWAFTTAKIITEKDFRAYFEMALQERALQKSYPFAIFSKADKQYLGCTRLGNIDFKNKKLEIGWTWLHPTLHGTGFNKNCKFLLLQYCFETLQLIRVELKTSVLNLQSQKAMLKIGATKEGILRKHLINDDGTVRDTMYFSIVDDEWPAIKENIFIGCT